MPPHSMGAPRTAAINWASPARRCDGPSWAKPVGSRITQAVSVSASQSSNRPSQVAISSRRMVIVQQPGNSGTGRVCRGRPAMGGDLATCISCLPAMDLIQVLESVGIHSPPEAELNQRRGSLDGN